MIILNKEKYNMTDTEYFNLMQLLNHKDDKLFCVLGDGKVREYSFRGIRIQKGYMPQIMGWYMTNDLKGKKSQLQY